jgi:hypothetical protein
MLLKQRAVGQAGERIVIRREGELLLRLLAGGDVTDDAVEESNLAVIVEDALPGRRGDQAG